MPTIIKDFLPQGGKHCITNSLKQVFSYYGCPMSEEMMFGLASGLSFLYLNQAASPMVSGRTKIFEFEQKLADRLNITVTCRSGKNYPRIFGLTRQMIDAGHPVLIYVDMPYLKYLGMDEDSHFGGHAVVIFGYDDENRQFYVSDRDNHDYPIRVPSGQIAADYHLVGYDEIERARSSSHRPFPAANKYLAFDFSGYRGIDQAVLAEAIRETCESMLNPPAQLLGLNGIRKFSKEIRKWGRFSPDKLQRAGITNYFQISRDGGTGGGIFRRMYGLFLTEAAPLMKNEMLAAAGRQFIDISGLWDQIAGDMWELSLHGDASLLPDMSDRIMELYEKERELYLALLPLSMI